MSSFDSDEEQMEMEEFPDGESSVAEWLQFRIFFIVILMFEQTKIWSKLNTDYCQLLMSCENL